MSFRQRLHRILRRHRHAAQEVQSLTLELRALQQRIDRIERGIDELRTVLNTAIDDLSDRAAALAARIDAR